MPFVAGEMGYPGTSGGYLPAAPMIQALNATGVPFEYYKNWDAAWFTPSDYFVNLPAATCHQYNVPMCWTLSCQYMRVCIYIYIHEYHLHILTGFAVRRSREGSQRHWEQYT